ncbi:MAG: MFS transporter [Syntrophobacterales bacterium]|nr:MFS transporter [Syntrophobacterales bacterium]
MAEERDNRKSVLIVTTVSSFLVPLSLATVNIALPTIGRELGATAIALNWIATAYLLTAAMFLVPFGKMADMFGRRRIFIYGMWWFTATSFCLGMAPSAGVLIFLRALQGVGAAMIFGTAVAIVSSVFPPGERGRALGINIAAVYMGLSCGPFFGGILTQQIGWRSVFFINVPMGLFVILLSIRKLKQEWMEAKGESFDFVGSFIYVLMLLMIMYGFSCLPSAAGGVFILLGAAAVGTLIWWELRTENPVLEIRLFITNKAFTFSNVAALISYSATFAVGFLMSFYLQSIKGLTPQNAGIILVSQPIVQAAFSPLAGRLSDRIEPRRVASAGMTVTAAGLLLLAFLQRETSLTFIAMSLVILGFGFALFSSPNTNAVMSSVEKRFYGIASSTLGTMRLVGQMLSMGIAMLVFAVYMGKTAITPQYNDLLLKSIKVIFSIFVVLCAAGIFASLKRGKLH